MRHLGSWPLLLLLVQCHEGDVCHFNYLEPDSGNVTDGVTFTSESCDKDFIVLFDVVEAAVVGDEGRNLFACRSKRWGISSCNWLGHSTTHHF